MLVETKSDGESADAALLSNYKFLTRHEVLRRRSDRAKRLVGIYRSHYWALMEELGAQKQIPEHAHTTTSIFIYATAGVRRLPSADSKWLLDTAWSRLKKNSPFLCQREWVKIISGTEEVYYGWTALTWVDHHCSQPESANPVIGGKHSGKGGKSGTAVLLTGAPNWEEYCSALAKAAVNLSEWSNLSPGMDCDLQPCALAYSLPRPHMASSMLCLVFFL
ncbi:hypothetical protein LWI29_000060 [Acer saccharum]|uniref:apyrase n=1 Tax=Acer saccharum TaxID=4024 RepID=A0AA39VXT1_ACESA|nr:hypothetical protein LWI29_000060 [Acer saccharum]